MPSAAINGIDLHYESHGDGPPLIFSHGALGNWVSWWQQVPALSPRYRCITVDQRGFGRSHELPGGPGIDGLPDDLIALLDHLGIERAVLVGQSLGGWTSLGAALSRPDRVAALLLSDSTARIADPEMAARQRQRRAEGAHDRPLVERALTRAFAEARPDLAFLYFQIAALNPPRAESYVAPYFGDGVIPTEALASIAVPTLFIAGTEDVPSPPEIIALGARHIPAARLVEVPGAGHSAHFEQAALFNRLLLDFLGGVPGWEP